MRKFNSITIGKILLDLREGENGVAGLPLLSRATLYRLEEQSEVYKPGRIGTKGEKKWRYYTEDEANKLKQFVRTHFNVL